MGLRVLCAGCPKDQREQVEREVRRALGRRVEAGAWTVSLVRLADKWSVTLDAPAEGVRAVTFVAPEGGLGEAIVGALEAPALPAAGRASAVESRTSWQCEKCREAFVVIYDAAPDEGQETAPVACPHCWHVNHVLVGESAAETRDYRAERA